MSRKQASHFCFICPWLQGLGMVKAEIWTRFLYTSSLATVKTAPGYERVGGIEEERMYKITFSPTVSLSSQPAGQYFASLKPQEKGKSPTLDDSCTWPRQGGAGFEPTASEGKSGISYYRQRVSFLIPKSAEKSDTPPAAQISALCAVTALGLKDLVPFSFQLWLPCLCMQT